MSFPLTPLEDKIIVKQAEAETQTASGLIIPDNAKEKPQQGEVLAVGPGRRDDEGKRVPMDVKVGDKVLYSKLVLPFEAGPLRAGFSFVWRLCWPFRVTVRNVDNEGCRTLAVSCLRARYDRGAM